MTLHRRALHPRRAAQEPMAMEEESEESDEDDDEDAEDEVPAPAAAAECEEEDEPAPVFKNIFEIMALNPFTDVSSE
jgi:hypothetical protein